jgi:hypothetical protein
MNWGTLFLRYMAEKVSPAQKENEGRNMMAIGEADTL